MRARPERSGALYVMNPKAPRAERSLAATATRRRARGTPSQAGPTLSDTVLTLSVRQCRSPAHPVDSVSQCRTVS